MAVSMNVHAQLASVDHGLAVEDGSGLMFANTVGTDLGWSSSGTAGSAQAWIAGLNAEHYGGYSDWTLATGDGSGGANTTTNQLAELFNTDCGGVSGKTTATMKGCGSFSALVSQMNSSQLGIILFSSSLYKPVPGMWWSYETPFSTQLGWSNDTQYGFQVGIGDAVAVRKAPEMNAAAAGSALAVLLGGLLVLRAKPVRKGALA
jgi:hypothetical protein